MFIGCKCVIKVGNEVKSIKCWDSSCTRCTYFLNGGTAIIDSCGKFHAGDRITFVKK